MVSDGVNQFRPLLWYVLFPFAFSSKLQKFADFAHSKFGTILLHFLCFCHLLFYFILFPLFFASPQSLQTVRISLSALYQFVPYLVNLFEAIDVQLLKLCTTYTYYTKKIVFAAVMDMNDKPFLYVAPFFCFGISWVFFFLFLLFLLYFLHFGWHPWSVTPAALQSHSLRQYSMVCCRPFFLFYLFYGLIFASICLHTLFGRFSER